MHKNDLTDAEFQKLADWCAAKRVRFPSPAQIRKKIQTIKERRKREDKTPGTQGR